MNTDDLIRNLIEDFIHHPKRSGLHLPEEYVNRNEDYYKAFLEKNKETLPDDLMPDIESVMMEGANYLLHTMSKDGSNEQ